MNEQEEFEFRLRLEKESAPAAVKVGKGLNDIPRQIGLTARYGLEGLANAAQVVTEPIRYVQDKLTPDRAPTMEQLVTNQRTPKSMPLGAVASQFADWVGLPKPDGANERVIGDATKLLAGAGGMGAAAGAARALPGAVGQAGGFLSSNMPAQLSSAVGAGLAGGASREAGGDAWMQAGSALLGGVAGGMAPGAVGSVANAVKGTFNKLTPQQLDAQIGVILQRGDVDYSQIPAAGREALRGDLRRALQAGQELDPEAVRRLADFRRVGATPTRGSVSQNPVQITREMNLAKIGANTSDDVLQGLPMIQNRNNSTLIRNLNDAGANQGDMMGAGQAAIGGIQSRNAALEGTKTAAYNALEALPGYRAPMGANPISRINAALGDEAAMPFMPKEISSYMESFLAPNAPAFTPQAYNNLQKMLSRASTSQDGNVRHAVGVAARALESTPVTAGNAVPTAASQAVANSADEAIQQLQVARAANRDWRTFQESARPIAAVVNGAQPDKFVQQFVINGTLDDARAVAQNAPVAEVKNAILAHLKEKALSGAADEVGKFSQAGFNKAINQIGERKLALYFSPEELAQLRAVGRVASYAQVQPVGSAVNNSNSGALMLGKGYDALKGLLDMVPGGQTFLTQPLRNIEVSMRNRQAQNVLPGLLTPPARDPAAMGLLLPGLAYGGLLTAP
jgi:hypothetical protein